MKIKSSAFENQATIPSRYTCEGENIFPPLNWEGVPEEAKALALVVDDPDSSSGKFTHWVIFNIPIIPAKLEEGASLSDRFSKGLREGFNDFGNQGYGGPCPPRGGGEHRYFFRLFALKDKLDISGRITRDQLMDAIEGSTLEEAHSMAKYGRS